MRGSAGRVREIDARHRSSSEVRSPRGTTSVGGLFPHGDTTQIPLGLCYTSVAWWNRFLAGGAPYTLSLLGSHGIGSTIIRLRPPGQEMTDFGHVDRFHARDADRLVWTPIANSLVHRDPSR